MCVSEGERARVFVCGGWRAGEAPSRCLLWFGDEELGVKGGLECVCEHKTLNVTSSHAPTHRARLMSTRALSLGGALSFHKFDKRLHSTACHLSGKKTRVKPSVDAQNVQKKARACEEEGA